MFIDLTLACLKDLPQQIQGDGWPTFTDHQSTKRNFRNFALGKPTPIVKTPQMELLTYNGGHTALSSVGTNKILKHQSFDSNTFKKKHSSHMPNVVGRSAPFCLRRVEYPPFFTPKQSDTTMSKEQGAERFQENPWGSTWAKTFGYFHLKKIWKKWPFWHLRITKLSFVVFNAANFEEITAESTYLKSLAIACGILGEFPTMIYVTTNRTATVIFLLPPPELWLYLLNMTCII